MCLVALVSTIGIYAQSSISHLRPSLDDDYTYTHLAVETTDAGEYYLSFWMLPAQLLDGSKSLYDIYVNNRKVGTITPTEPNWQSISLDNNKKVFLQKGISIISIAAKGREIPLVEDVKYAKTISESQFSSEAYDSYLSQASSSSSEESWINSQHRAVSSQEDVQSRELMATYGVKRGDLFTDVPVYYSFHMTRRYEEGETINVTTTGTAPHYIDIFYVNSTPLRLEPYPLYPRDFVKEGEVKQTSNLGMGNKFILPFWRIAECDRFTQQLGWLAISQKARNNSFHIASKTILAPKTGLYFIKVRRQTEGDTGVADVIVDNLYFYEKQPIACSGRQAVMPRGEERVAMTLKLPEDTDENLKYDPWIFIEGAGGHRVVAYDDDASQEQRQKYGAKRNDAVIEMSYDMPTTGFHLVSYRSETPKFLCHVITDLDPKGDESMRFERQTIPTRDVCSLLEITTDGQSLSLQRREPVKLISLQILDINGIALFTSACNASDDKSRYQIDISSLKNETPTIYYVVIDTDQGVCSKNINL